MVYDLINERFFLTLGPQTKLFERGFLTFNKRQYNNSYWIKLLKVNDVYRCNVTYISGVARDDDTEGVPVHPL